MNWGNHWGAGKRMGREGGGGGQYTSSLGPEWTGIAPHAKEGFQVSKRESGTGKGSSRQRGNYQGDRKGLSKGLCHVPPDNINLVHIVPMCVCRANKRIVFRL